MHEAAGLIYERTPGWAEGWVRVSLEHGDTGPRVVIEGHNYEYRLVPTAFVLEGLTEALRAITDDELRHRRARLGPVGVRALERLRSARRMAA